MPSSLSDIENEYEDGQGHVVDENGVEPMDVVGGVELFAIETIITRTYFLINKPSKIPKTVLHPILNKRNNEDIDMEIRKKRRKCLKSSVAQRWAKRYYEDHESIFGKKNKSSRRHIFLGGPAFDINLKRSIADAQDKMNIYAAVFFYDFCTEASNAWH